MQNDGMQLTVQQAISPERHRIAAKTTVEQIEHNRIDNVSVMTGHSIISRNVDRSSSLAMAIGTSQRSQLRKSQTKIPKKKEAPLCVYELDCVS